MLRMAETLDDLGDPEPWLCGDWQGDPELRRHSRDFEPYHCGAIWSPRTEHERENVETERG